MELCTDCLHLDDRKIEHCPSCGGNEFAHSTKKGDVVSVPAGAGMPCQNCFEIDHDLKLRYYRRVLGMIFAARMWGEAGYFCASCRRKRFGANLGFTMLLGWWGIFALFFYNPYAILVNLWALFAPPFGAGSLGAMNVNEIRADAAEDADRRQRLSDVYMQMPGWVDSLEEDEIELVIADSDYYAALGATRTGTHVEIKAAWREQVKRHHPDTAGAAGHERMVEINKAYKVLGDERLRHAYDHREQLLAFADAVDAAEGDDGDEGERYAYGCEVCRFGFLNFDEAAEHCDSVHPDSDYVDLLVRLDGDDENEHEPSAPGPEGASTGWRCKACGQVFPEYDDALVHAQDGHPDRHVVDIRAAVEPA
jgi:hypothetical protein